MYLSLLTILLALTARAHAIAFHHHPSGFNFFINSDCSDKPAAPWTIDEYNKHCIPITAATDNIGFHWGQGFFVDLAYGLHVYKDTVCKVWLKDIRASNQTDPTHVKDCYSVKENCGPWGSVMFTHGKFVELAIDTKVKVCGDVVE